MKAFGFGTSRQRTTSSVRLAALRSSSGPDGLKEHGHSGKANPKGGDGGRDRYFGNEALTPEP